MIRGNHRAVRVVRCDALSSSRALAGAMTVPGRSDESARADAFDQASELKLTEGVAIGDIASWGRRAVNPDAVADAMALVARSARPRKATSLGCPAGLGDGERSWNPIHASAKGEFDPLPSGSYVACSVTSESDRVMILDASGDTMVYENGEPHAGDPNSIGKLHIPIELKKGANQGLRLAARRRVAAHGQVPRCAAERRLRLHRRSHAPGCSGRHTPGILGRRADRERDRSRSDAPDHAASGR